MMSNWAAGAVMAKSRAMYGRRLHREDYEAMMACRNVGAIAAYLQQKPEYADVLSESNVGALHRAQLEKLLKQKLFLKFATLYRYEKAVGEFFAEYIIARSEARIILDSVMGLQEGRFGETQKAQFMPEELRNNMGIDFEMLGEAMTYEKFAEATAKSRYAGVIAAFKPDLDARIPITAMENAVYSKLYNDTFELIKNKASKKEKQELLSIFETYIDLINFVRIVRMKKYYGMTIDQMKDMMLPNGNLGLEKLEKMMGAETTQKAIDIAYTSLLKNVITDKNVPIDDLPDRGKADMARKYIRFSTKPSVVMLCYMFLSEIEIWNVIHIIEGIRYNVSPNEIWPMIIYID